jgi:hypothetical protein
VVVVHLSPGKGSIEKHMVGPKRKGQAVLGERKVIARRESKPTVRVGGRHAYHRTLAGQTVPPRACPRGRAQEPEETIARVDYGGDETRRGSHRQRTKILRPVHDLQSIEARDIHLFPVSFPMPGKRVGGNGESPEISNVVEDARGLAVETKVRIRDIERHHVPPAAGYLDSGQKENALLVAILAEALEVLMIGQDDEIQPRLSRCARNGGGRPGAVGAVGMDVKDAPRFFRAARRAARSGPEAPDVGYRPSQTAHEHHAAHRARPPSCAPHGRLQGFSRRRTSTTNSVATTTE